MKKLLTIALASIVISVTAQTLTITGTASAQTLPSGADPESQITTQPRDYGLVLQADNPTTNTLNLELSRFGSDPFWSEAVEPETVHEELILMRPGVVAFQGIYQESSASIPMRELRIFSDFNRPDNPYITVVAEAVKITGTQAIIDRSREIFLTTLDQQGEVPEPLARAYAAILISSFRSYLVSNQRSPERGVRAALDDARDGVSNALNDETAEVPLQIHLAFINSAYMASLEALTNRLQELETLVTSVDQTIPDEFAATFTEQELP